MPRAVVTPNRVAGAAALSSSLCCSIMAHVAEGLLHVVDDDRHPAALAIGKKRTSCTSTSAASGAGSRFSRS